MEPLGIIRAAGVLASAVGLFLLAFAWAARQRRRRVARGQAAIGRRSGAGAADFAPVAHRLELRLAALEQGQAGLAARLDGAGGAEERLQATAGQLLGLVRDKNATLETALAGLDQLRSRMRTLEQIGDAAEARGLFERLGERLAGLESAQAASQAAAQAAAEAALAARAGEAGAPQQAALLEQLSRLHAQKDAAMAAVLARLAPVESRLGRLEGAAPAEALTRLERAARRARRRPGRHPGGARRAEARRRRAGDGTGRAAEPARRREGRAGRAAARPARGARIRAGGARPASRARRHRRLLRERIALLETPGENPFAAVAAQLAGLHAQKDAATEAVLTRLAPLEARLGAVESGLAARDPRRSMPSTRGWKRCASGSRLLETPGESPFAEVAAQLAGLHAQKDAAPRRLLTRLAALEARLEMAGRDPQGALDGFAARLEALRERIAGAGDAGGEPVRRGRGAARRAPRPEGRGDRGGARAAGAAGGAARGAGGRARRRDPRGALDGLAARLEAAQALREAAEAGLRERIALLETPGENPFAAVAAQLAELHAQKDALAEGLLTRLAALEAEVAGRDPQGALDGLAVRLEAAQALREAAEAGLRERVALLEAPGESPVAELAAQLAGLYAQKDAATEAVLTRLEETLRRIAALEAAGAPFAEISEQLSRLYAQKDASGEALTARLEAVARDLDRRLAAVEEGGGREEEAARAEAQAIATQLIAMRAAAAQTELFADRIALLEASLPRLSVTQSLMMQALERQAGVAPAAAGPAAEVGTAAPADPLEAFRDLPRIVSLHQK